MIISELLISVTVGMLTGMLSGWLSGAMVTNHYRKLDEEQQRRELHVKCLEEITHHVSKVLNEIDLLIHRDGPLDYENLLREIGIIHIPDGKPDEKDASSVIVREEAALMSQLSKEAKEGTIDLPQASLLLIKLSAKLMTAMDRYRREKKMQPL